MEAQTRARFKLPRKRWILLVAAVAMLSVAVPVALATFTDVPGSDPFYADVNAIQGAGITSGCGGGNFCPSANITREAEAAFVHRAGVRLGYSGQQGNYTVDTSAPVDIADATVSVGGVAGQTQFVKVDASIGAYAAGADIPEDVLFWIDQDGVGQVTFGSGMTLAVAGPSGIAIGDGSFSIAVAVPTGTTQTFRLMAQGYAGSGSSQVWGGITAATAPFGSTGTSTLAPTGKASAISQGGLGHGR